MGRSIFGESQREDWSHCSSMLYLTTVVPRTIHPQDLDAGGCHHPENLGELLLSPHPHKVPQKDATNKECTSGISKWSSGRTPEAKARSWVLSMSIC